MFVQAFKQAFGVLAKKPLRLWGLSMLFMLISGVASLVSVPVAVVGIAFGYVLTAGMSKVYLDGLEGKQVNSDQIFEGTKRFFRVAGGMAWRDLWNIIWGVGTVVGSIVVIAIVSLIFGGIHPVVGVIFGILLGVACGVFASVVVINRQYSYAFVPYILMTQPDVTATEALRLSVKLTKGKVLHMWLADLVCGALIVIGSLIVGLILGLLSAIPIIGGIFGAILVVYVVALIVFLPIFQGLYRAAFYKLPKPAPKAANKIYSISSQCSLSISNLYSLSISSLCSLSISSLYSLSISSLYSLSISSLCSLNISSLYSHRILSSN